MAASSQSESESLSSVSQLESSFHSISTDTPRVAILAYLRTECVFSILSNSFNSRREHSLKNRSFSHVIYLI